METQDTNIDTNNSKRNNKTKINNTNSSSNCTSKNILNSFNQQIENNAISRLNNKSMSTLSLNDILELENLFVNEINKTNSNIESLKKQIEEYKYKILKLKNG